MQIKILDSNIEPRTSKAGKNFNVQVLLVELDGERRKLEIFHNDNSKVYKAGLYKIADSSFHINDYKKLEIKWLKFEPVQAAAAVRTA